MNQKNWRIAHSGSSSCSRKPRNSKPACSSIILILLISGLAKAGDYFSVRFDSTNDVSGPPWQNWFGWAYSGLSWDATSDASNNPASGSLKIIAQFPSAVPPIGACCGPQYVVMNGLDGISPPL